MGLCKHTAVNLPRIVIHLIWDWGFQFSLLLSFFWLPASKIDIPGPICLLHIEALESCFSKFVCIDIKSLKTPGLDIGT